MFGNCDLRLVCPLLIDEGVAAWIIASDGDARRVALATGASLVKWVTLYSVGPLPARVVR
jgi:hypothetical protein